MYHLDRTPPGLHYDEAFNATQARDVLRGVNRPIFFTGNFGEEPLHMYLEAAAFALGGESSWVVRWVSAMLGVLWVAALYFCARSFFPSERLLPLAAAFIGATLYWSINFSRIGIETTTLPFVLTLSAGALALANTRHDWRWSAAAGILTGATLYTYLAARVWVPAVFVWAIYLLVVQRRQMRRWFHNWMVIAIFFTLTVAPLTIFFLLNPTALTGRAGQVLTPELFSTNLARTAGMFFIRGDADPRDNLPGRPALDFFLTALFLIGIAVALARAKKSSHAFLLIWFIVMTLPSALTDFAPNFRRAIGALPAVVLLCAAGLDWVWKLEGGRWKWKARGTLPSPQLARVIVGALLATGLAFSAWSSASAYFSDWARGSGLFYSFDAGLLQVAQLLAARPANEQLYISPDYHDHPTVQWALDGRAFSSFDGRHVAVLPNSALPATYVIITREDRRFSPQDFFPNAQEAGTLEDFENKPYAEIFQVPAPAVPMVQPQNKLDAHIGESVRVLGYDLTREGERIDLKIYWRAEARLREDYTVFVHLLGPTNPAAQSPLWSQDDAQPGHGSYPTSRWQIGETIVDAYELKIPRDAPLENYQIEAGMYLLSSGARLPVSVDGKAVLENRLVLNPIAK